MNKYLICIAALTLTTAAHAATQLPSSCIYEDSSSGHENCKTTKSVIRCPSGTYYDCATCLNGSDPIPTTVKVSTYETITYDTCPLLIVPTSCPDTCPNTTWTDVSGQNYQVRCNDSQRLTYCENRCKQGYYGSSTACERCLASGGTYGTTSGPGASAITECYLPSGTSFSNSTGSGTYTDNCYYTN